jgi:hypothetical protein
MAERWFTLPDDKIEILVQAGVARVMGVADDGEPVIEATALGRRIIDEEFLIYLGGTEHDQGPTSWRWVPKGEATTD